MPRRPRIDFPGAFHHVYARGIEKRDIFQDQQDREEFHRRILKNLKRFNASCLAWAFLPNHFHLLYHSKSGNLPDFMRCLMSGYSIYFNKKYYRSGHLFQNRYKSSVIDTERYWLELIRYIHLNPVRSGIVTTVASLSKYPWSGHFEIMASGRLPWDEYPFIHDFFSSTYLSGIAIYLAFLEQGLSDRSVEALFEQMDREGKNICGDSNENIPTGNQDGAHRIFSSVIGKVSRQYSVPVDRILDGRRDRISSYARREILRECVRDKGIARRSVCKWLGISDAGGLYLLRAADNAIAKSSILNRD